MINFKAELLWQFHQRLACTPDDVTDADALVVMVHTEKERAKWHALLF